MYVRLLWYRNSSRYYSYNTSRKVWATLPTTYGPTLVCPNPRKSASANGTQLVQSVRLTVQGHHISPCRGTVLLRALNDLCQVIQELINALCCQALRSISSECPRSSPSDSQ